MVFTVFFSSSISPLTSAVIFCDRSPFATAVVTSAMLRTWPVRLLAMKFTESVRSFHVPPTPGTSAWPPSTPSVPTSRATRVTSEAKEESWSTMVFTVVPMRRNSPWTDLPSISSTIFCDRSPRATAVSTRAISVVGCVRSVISEFTASMLRAHPPPRPFILARSIIFPSRPTVLLTRTTSLVTRSLVSATRLKAAEIRAMSGSPSRFRRAAKSPSPSASRQARSCWRPSPPPGPPVPSPATTTGPPPLARTPFPPLPFPLAGRRAGAAGAVSPSGVGRTGSGPGVDSSRTATIESRFGGGARSGDARRTHVFARKAPAGGARQFPFYRRTIAPPQELG